MSGRMTAMAAACIATMTIGTTAWAGVWASTTIDEAPDEFRVGVTHEVIYTVLQHGSTPVEGSTALVFRPAKGTMSSAFEIVFRGFPTGVPGQYRAHLELPATGVWIWEVDQGGLGTIDVGSVEVSPVTNGARFDELPLLPMVIAGAVVILVVLRKVQALSPNSYPASRITSST